MKEKENTLANSKSVSDAPPAAVDHWIGARVSSVSSDPKVHRAVEESVQLACEVVRWQELAGEVPGSVPSLEGSDEDRVLGAESLEHLARAHETFKRIVDIFSLSMRERWASALANNIEAMDLGQGQPEVAWMIRHAQESACTCPIIPESLAGQVHWRNRFGSAKWGKFVEGAPLFAHLALISVAVAHGDENLEIFEDGWDNESESQEKGDAQMDIQSMVNLDGPMVMPKSFDANGLVNDPVALRKAAKKAMALSGISRDHFARGIVLPRLFSHEELEGLSLQSLHDVPRSMLMLLNANLQEEQFELATMQMLSRGIGGAVLSDVDLLARSRVHYFMTIVYTQAPKGNHAAFEGNGPWPRPLEIHEQASLDDALAPAMSAVMDGEMEILVASLDLFFHALRDGVRRQRAQATLEQIAMAMHSAKAKADDCYFSIATEQMVENQPQSLVLNLFNGWFEQIADVSWPLVTFDAPYTQALHLKKIAETLGFRHKHDIILIKEGGFA